MCTKILSAFYFLNYDFTDLKYIIKQYINNHKSVQDQCK